ncbi:hypothetical protein LPC_2760 [Legionella pneumophila str. Corby]|nr:hypothetical protein LPC_2760 [Legionella pneumophila str. Corby]
MQEDSNLMKNIFIKFHKFDVFTAKIKQ